MCVYKFRNLCLNKLALGQLDLSSLRYENKCVSVFIEEDSPAITEICQNKSPCFMFCM